MLCGKFKMADEFVPFVGKDENFRESAKKQTEKDRNVKFLISIGQKTSGNNEEIKERADLFRKQPELTRILEKEVKAREQTTRVFGRELDRNEIPLPEEPWKNGRFPTFTPEQLSQYAQSKLPGRKSMFEKGERFFNSRKVVTMRVLQRNNETWVRAWVRQSYGSVQRPAHIKFNKMGAAVGGSCTCTVGLSGLCAHVIAVFYELIHVTQTGSLKLEIQCTNRPQKWHKKGSNSSNKQYAPVHSIEIKSARKRKYVKDLPEKTTKKKATPKKRKLYHKVEEISKKLNQIQVETHFLQTIGQNKVLRERSGLYPLLADRYIVKSSAKDHDYCSPPPNKTEDVITERSLDLPDPSEIHPAGASLNNTSILYYPVKQRSQEWYYLRKNKITSSAVSDLIGIGGSSKYEEAWAILKGQTEAKPMNFINFQRGIEYEDEARTAFIVNSGVAVSECGIFFRDGIGASPDGLLSIQDYLLEIKTRSINSKCSLLHLEKYHLVQCQLQMYCSGRDKTILMSYLPEQKTANYFLIKYNTEFVSVLLTCLSSMSSCLPLQDCHRWDSSCQKLSRLWEINMGSIPDFKSLLPLRSWIGQLIKDNTPLTDVKALFNV